MTRGGVWRKWIITACWQRLANFKLFISTQEQIKYTKVCLVPQTFIRPSQFGHVCTVSGTKHCMCMTSVYKVVS